MPWRTTYQGHYIVLCGYDIERQKVFYRNPSFDDRKFFFITKFSNKLVDVTDVCQMSLSILEEARKSYGTDEDVIFIYK